MCQWCLKKHNLLVCLVVGITLASSYHFTHNNWWQVNTSKWAVNNDDEQTFEAEISTLRECDTCCGILLLKTVTERSIVHFPQFKDVTKYISRQLQHRNIYTHSVYPSMCPHIPTIKILKQPKTLNNKTCFMAITVEKPQWSSKRVQNVTQWDSSLTSNKHVNLTSSNTLRSGGKRREASDLTTAYNVCSALCWQSGSVTRTASRRTGISCGQLRGQSRRAIFPIKTDNCTAIWHNKNSMFTGTFYIHCYLYNVY